MTEVFSCPSQVGVVEFMDGPFGRGIPGATASRRTTNLTRYVG